MLEQTIAAITKNVDTWQIITGAISAGFTAFIMAMFTGAAAFIYWRMKQKLEKKEKLQEQKGPVLYKLEHDAECTQWRDEQERLSEARHEQVIDALRETKEDIVEMKGSIREVHRRVDDFYRTGAR